MVPGLLRDLDPKQKHFCAPKAEIISEINDHEDLLVTVKATTFCHGVYLDTGDGCTLSDNYFDLLPGESRMIRVAGSAGKHYELKIIPIN